jgi:O-antigen ligase
VNARSLWVYRCGVVVIAVLLPLDRIGFLSFLHISILSLILLAQRWVYVIASRVRSHDSLVFRKLSYVFVLPIFGALVTQSFSGLSHPLNHAAFTIILLASRAFLIAQLLEKEDIKLFERVTILVSVAVIGFGFYQYIADVFHAPLWVSALSAQYTSGWTYFFPRPQSTALEPLYLAYYLVLPIALLSLPILRGQQLPRWQRVLLVSMYAMLLLSLARGAIIGIIVMITAAIITIRPVRKELLVFARVIVMAILLTASMTILAVIVSGSHAFGSFTSHAVDLNDESAQTRYRGINPAIRAFLERPITGHGIVNNGDNVTSRKVNNSYLTILIEQGLLGVLALSPIGWAICSSLAQSYRQKLSLVASPYTLSIIAMLVQANTFEAFQLLRSWVVLALLISGLMVDYNRKPTLKENA